jgi:thiol:disulfide interchange protein DsbC
MKIFQAVAVISAVLLMFIFTPACQTADKGDINVAEKCPELEMKKVDAIVKKVVPDGNTVDIKESPVKGVWEIGVESKGQRGSIFLDCSGKYLIQLTQLDAYLAQIQAQQTPQKVDISKIPLGDSITVGAKKAAKKVIVFTDPDCPYCRTLQDSIKKVIAKRPDIAFVEILYPLPMHTDAPKKVQSILCSKSVKMLQDAFSGKVTPEPPANCTTDAMDRNTALARALNFNSTPTLVRDDGTVLAGFLPEDKLLEWIDKKP